MLKSYRWVDEWVEWVGLVVVGAHRILLSALILGLGLKV